MGYGKKSGQALNWLLCAQLPVTKEKKIEKFSVRLSTSTNVSNNILEYQKGYQLLTSPNYTYTLNKKLIFLKTIFSFSATKKLPEAYESFHNSYS